MRVAVPHSLGREEVRRRLKGRIHELADLMPGGMAEVSSQWPNEDCMDLKMVAMGQTVAGSIDIDDATVTVEVALPLALSFVEPLIRGAIEKNSRKLLT
jgi:hypothetical protein